MPLRLSLACQAFLLCAGLALSPIALAASSPAASDPEEQVDEGLKGFGYMAGLALGCVATEQRTALNREVMDLNAEISRLLGIGRAGQVMRTPIQGLLAALLVTDLIWPAQALARWEVAPRSARRRPRGGARETRSRARVAPVHHTRVRAA